jgi:hypothetical protein
MGGEYKKIITYSQEKKVHENRIKNIKVKDCVAGSVTKCHLFISVSDNSKARGLKSKKM